MKSHHVAVLCLLVFVVGVSVGVFATRSFGFPPPSSANPAIKAAPAIVSAASQQPVAPPPASRLKRIAEAPPSAARYITTRPALPPVLEPAAQGQPAWRTDPHEWHNVGRQTVGAAIQSQYWAISRGETDYLASALHLDTDARRQLQDLHSNASLKLREQFPTPESFAAFLLASQPAVEGMAIGTRHPTSVSDTDITVSVPSLPPAPTASTPEARNASAAPTPVNGSASSATAS